MSRVPFLAAFGMTLLLASLNGNGADVVGKSPCIDDKGRCGMIAGVIVPQDVGKVAELIKRLEKQSGYKVVFYVDSNGGDVRSAIAIGRLLRKARAQIWVGRDQNCLSACVFLLAGAVERWPIGGVGIHRPYSTNVTTRSFDDTQRMFRELENLSKQFLSEMNIPPALFDAMMRVSPQSMRTLSGADLHAFGLLGTDPVEQDMQDVAKARSLGISRQELLERKARGEQQCSKYLEGEGRGSNYFSCIEVFLRGFK